MRFGNHISLSGLRVGGWGEEILQFGERKKAEKRCVLSFLFSKLGRIVIGFGFQNWGEILAEIFEYE